MFSVAPVLKLPNLTNKTFTNQTPKNKITKLAQPSLTSLQNGN